MSERSQTAVMPMMTVVGWTLTLALLSLGCSKIDRSGTPLEQTGPAPTATEEPAGPVGGPPIKPPVIGGDSRPECKLNKLVREPEEGTAEYVVAALYDAAVAPDDEASFQRFYANFLPKHHEGWVREQYWPRIRQHVDKYLLSRSPVTFYICRTMDVTGGIKLFIRSNDPKKSDPPIALMRTPSGWKVDTFSY